MAGTHETHQSSAPPLGLDYFRLLPRPSQLWLNPPEWTREEVLEFPGSVDGPWARYVDPATVRWIANPLPQAGEGGERSEPGEGGGQARRRRRAVSTPKTPSPQPSPASGRGSTRSARPLPEGEGGKIGIGTVRYPRVVPRDEECAKELKRRTLTNLYNERPTWLDLAHRKLDEAVFAAYGWDPSISDEELLAKLLELNLQRAPG